jgi:hypothetical protein
VHAKSCEALAEISSDQSFIRGVPPPQILGTIDDRIFAGIEGMRLGEPVSTWGRYMAERGLLRTSEELENRPAVRYTTNTLTYPLTMARWLPEVLPLERVMAAGDQGRALNVVVLGVRAEGVLPPHLWRELPIAMPGVFMNVTLVGREMPDDFVGRELPIGPMTLRWARGDLASVPPSLLPARPDVAVLFHSGIGHKSGQLSWRPTMEALFAQGTPVLFTSFDQKDSDDDLHMVKSLLEDLGHSQDKIRWKVHQQINPFRSHLGAVTHQEPDRVCYANHHIFALKVEHS